MNFRNFFYITGFYLSITTLVFASPNKNSHNCLSKKFTLDSVLTNTSYDNDNSDFGFCFATGQSEGSRYKQCFKIRNLREAIAGIKINKFKSIKLNRSLENGTGGLNSNFGSQLQVTLQGELKINKSSQKFQMCDRSYLENPKCKNITISKSLKTKIFENKKKDSAVLSFWNSDNTGFLVQLNKKSQSGENLRKLIVAKNSNNGLQYLYKTNAPSTGLEFHEGYFRNQRIFLNDCTAGPHCTLSRQKKNRNRFETFPMNGHELQEITLYHNKVLLMNFDAGKFVLYDDKSHEIENIKTYPLLQNISVPAVLIRLENNFLVIYQGDFLGRIDSIDPVCLKKSPVLKINKCK